MGVFDNIGDSARMRELTGDNKVADSLLALGKKPEDRDIYDRTSIQSAPLKALGVLAWLLGPK